MVDDEHEGIPVQKPRADIYLVLLLITFGATLLATVVMWYESTL